MGYANVLYNRERLSWKGEMKNKPSELRCFKFFAKPNNNTKEKAFSFCVFNKRMDWGSKSETIPPYQAMYVNDNWVSALNMKLHTFNLETSQEKMLRTVGKIDCNAHIMEPIKFEIRLRVNKLIKILVHDNET